MMPFLKNTALCFMLHLTMAVNIVRVYSPGALMTKCYIVSLLTLAYTPKQTLHFEVQAKQLIVC